MTELRGRQRQGDSRSGVSRAIRAVRGELDRLGGMIEENIAGNRRREQQQRQERERVNSDRGPERGRQYIRNDQRGRDAGILNEGAQRDDVQAVNNTAAYMRRTGGMPEITALRRGPNRGAHLARNDLQEAVDLVNEANVSDARMRDASVDENNLYADGAELTRGEGPGRRGVLQRPFTVRVDGQDVPISDDQRMALSEYINEHPRAFDTFADWFNAISTIRGVTPDQLNVEQVVMARRQWDGSERGGVSGLAPPNAEFTLDPNYVRMRGDVTYGAEYRYRNIDMGIDPETGQRRIVGQRLSSVRGPQGPMPDAPESARRPITPEERLTAESELMRIVNRNRSAAGRGRSRTIQRAASDDPNTLQPVVNLPRQIAEAVIARSRLSDEVRDLRRTQQRDDNKTSPKPGNANKDGTPLMTSQEVVDEQVARQRAADGVSGVTLTDQQQVDPFTREPILPIRPPEEGESGGSRTIRRLRNAGRANIGGVDLEPTENGVRGSIRW